MSVGIDGTEVQPGLELRSFEPQHKAIQHCVRAKTNRYFKRISSLAVALSCICASVIFGHNTGEVG
jgi:hypothetical protein